MLITGGFVAGLQHVSYDGVTNILASEYYID